MLAIVIFVFMIFQADAQTPADSLRAEAEKASGTRQIDLLNELAMTFFTAKNDAGLRIAKDALDLSTAASYRQGMAGARSVIGSYQSLAGDQEKALETYFQALRDVENNESLKITGELYAQIGDAYAMSDMKDEAYLYLKKSLPILFAHKDTFSVAFNSNYLGWLYWQESALDSAFIYYQNALMLRESIGDKSGIATTSNNIGFAYYQRGNYEQALTYFLKAQRLLEALGDTVKTTIQINNIGVTYRDWGKTDEALAYFNRALMIGRETGNLLGIGYSLSNIGSVHESKGDYPAALDYYHQSLEQYQLKKDKRGIMIGMNNLGKLFTLTGHFDSTMTYASGALLIARELKEIEQQSIALASIGVALMHLNDYHGARENFDESLRLSRTIGTRNQIKNTYLHLSELSERMGNFKDALAYYRQFTALKDSLFNEETSRNIETLKIEYETDKINRDIESLRIKTSHQATVIRRNRTIFLLFGLLFAIIALSTAIFIRLYNDKKKAFAILEETNAELSRERNRIEEQKCELEKAFSKIKTLSGLLPICASCKKIRDDKGYWTEVEGYIINHSDASFTHGICPDCTLKLYPEYAERMRNNQSTSDEDGARTTSE